MTWRGSCLFGLLKDSSTWMTIYFSRFRRFSTITLLNIFSMPAAYTSSPSSMSMTCSFGLLTVYLRSACYVVTSLFFLYLHLNIVILYLVFKPWYSVLNMIQFTGVAFNWVFYLTYWAFPFHTFYFTSFRISLLNSSFISCIVFLISFSSYLCFLGIHSCIYSGLL
jgi:hypothetical protein